MEMFGRENTSKIEINTPVESKTETTGRTQTNSSKDESDDTTDCPEDAKKELVRKSKHNLRKKDSKKMKDILKKKPPDRSETRRNIFEGKEAFSHLETELQYEISAIYNNANLMKELTAFSQFYLLMYKKEQNTALLGEDIVCILVQKLITGKRSRDRDKYPDFKNYCKKIIKSIVSNEKKKGNEEDNASKLMDIAGEEEITTISNHSRYSKKETEDSLEYKEFSEYVRSKIKEYDPLTQKVFKLALKEYQNSEIAVMLKTTVYKVELSKKKYLKLKREYKEYFNRETTKEKRLRKAKQQKQLKTKV